MNYKEKIGMKGLAKTKNFKLRGCLLMMERFVNL
jgi:hypothetical protein